MKSYELFVEYTAKQTRQSMMEGKEPGKYWSFCGWSTLPDLSKMKHKRVGKYLYVETSSGRERYTIDYPA